MKQVLDIEAFLAHGAGAYFIQEHFLAWHLRPRVLGVATRGAYERGSFDQRVRILDHHTQPGCQPLRILLDCRQSLDTTPRAYAHALDFWMSRRARHAAAIERFAVVIPDGLVGGVVAGLSVILKFDFPVRLFQELEPALSWLGVEDRLLLAQVLQLHEPEPADLIGRVHHAMIEAQFTLGLREVARSLGMSERSLQRHLRLAGTTFQTELARARISAAKRQMLAGKRNMTAIALELGFASLQHFSARFKALDGQTPSAWLRSCDEP